MICWGKLKKERLISTSVRTIITLMHVKLFPSASDKMFSYVSYCSSRKQNKKNICSLCVTSRNYLKSSIFDLIYNKYEQVDLPWASPHPSQSATAADSSTKWSLDRQEFHYYLQRPEYLRTWWDECLIQKRLCFLQWLQQL